MHADELLCLDQSLNQLRTEGSFFGCAYLCCFVGFGIGFWPCLADAIFQVNCSCIERLATVIGGDKEAWKCMLREKYQQVEWIRDHRWCLPHPEYSEGIPILVLPERRKVSHHELWRIECSWLGRWVPHAVVTLQVVVHLGLNWMTLHTIHEATFLLLP